MSTETQDARVRRGHRAVDLHPDLGPNGIDFTTAAVDVIADILHALTDQGLLFDDGPAHPIARDILDRALRTFEGDAEDEAPPMRIYRLDSGTQRTRTTLADYGLAGWFVRDEKTGRKIYPARGDGDTYMACQSFIERNGGTL